MAVTCFTTLVKRPLEHPVLWAQVASIITMYSSIKSEFLYTEVYLSQNY